MFLGFPLHSMLFTWLLPRLIPIISITGVAVCCINCITWAVQYFNKYAYIEIALYGKAYIPAAKDTWHLFKARGVDALVNDSLVSYCFTFGACEYCSLLRPKFSLRQVIIQQLTKPFSDLSRPRGTFERALRILIPQVCRTQ